MTIEYIYPSQTPGLDRLSPRAFAAGLHGQLFGAEAFSFKDILDVVNPLQQLPVIGSLYRAATGDTISTAARLAGGALLGGPAGFMVAGLSAGFEAATGGGIGDYLAALTEGTPAERRYAVAAYARTAELG